MSGRDSPEEKWGILKQVTEMFEAVLGREPVVWIDKMLLKGYAPSWRSPAGGCGPVLVR